MKYVLTALLLLALGFVASGTHKVVAANSVQAASQTPVPQSPDEVSPLDAFYDSAR